MYNKQNFKLHSNFSPAGDQALEGVTGSDKTYTMASVIEKVKMPTIIMNHNKTLAAQLYSKFKIYV